MTGVLKSIALRAATLISTATSLNDLAYITKALKDSGMMTADLETALKEKTMSLASASNSLKDLSYMTKALAPTVADGFSLMDESAPYGWLYNDIDEGSYRLGHNILTVQMGMRRVVTTGGNPMFGGKVYRYLSPTDSTKFEDGSDASSYINDSVAGVANGYQVFVEVPRFNYDMYKIGSLNYYWMGIKPFTGSQTHEMFRKAGWTAGTDGTDPANENAYGYISAFEGVLYDASATAYVDGIATAPTLDLVNDKLVSITGYKPTSTITIVQGRTLCENGASKQFDWHRYSAMRLLFNIEYMTHNSQIAISGYTDNTSGPVFDLDALKTGLTTSLGNASGSISGSEAHLAGGGDGGYSGVVANSYRGIENFYGHMWNFVDAINYSNGQPFVCQIYDTFASDTFTGAYVRAADTDGQLITQPLFNGYQSKLYSGGYFIEAVGASSIEKITDYYYYASGNRVLLSGGDLYDAASAGVGCLLAAYASTHVLWTFCSRL